jgi:hypothetical protein
MAVQAEPSWSSLPPETREVFEWAVACEKTSRDVGTRALLIGILRAGNGASTADVLLRHFGISHSQLFTVLQGGDLDPNVAERKELSDWPVLTPNARSCLIGADELRADSRIPGLNVECLFGALLTNLSTARWSLSQILTSVSIEKIADHYLRWLRTSGESGSGDYAEALENLSKPAAKAGSDGEVHLISLLQQQAQGGSPYQTIGLSLVVAGGLLLTTVEVAKASHALRNGSLYGLEWRKAHDSLAAAQLVPPYKQFTSKPSVREPVSGAKLRCYAVSDNGAAVRTLVIHSLTEAVPRGSPFMLKLATELPTGCTLTGSPVLDDSDSVVGMVQSHSVDGLTVISAGEIEEFLATLEIPAAGDMPPAVVIGNSSGAGNDTVAETDQLGFDVYVEAFADLIMSEHTRPPLTIGIFGSWGMGKSFLLSHIQRTIDRRQAAGTRAGPKIRTVCFNAWEYSATDAIWPALVRKVVKELDQLSSWPRRKRVWTRLRWNLRRELRSLATKLVTAGLVLAIVAAFAVGKHGLAVGLGGLTALLGIGGLVKAANDPVAKWVTGLFAGSDYGGQIGLMEDIKHDLEELEGRLHVGGDPNKAGLTGRILVIIDDLDRCEPAKAVEVLQAVNLLLNFPSFIVCLGIDARIITAAIEKHYEGLLGVAGASGYEYLDKIVQIPFRIPEPNPSDIWAFIRSQLAVRPEPASTRELTSAELIDMAAANGLVQSRDDESNGAAEQPRPTGKIRTLTVLPQPSATTTSPAASEVLFTLDEQQAFELFVPYLRPNPRHLKRLINVYRLVRSLGLAEGERLVLDRPAAVLRWLIMWAQWPLTSSMLLRRLDGPGADAGQEADPMLALLGQVERFIDRKARADRDDDPAKLRGLLEVPGCVLSVDEIRRIRRYTVNFNPAIEEQLRGSDGNPSEVPESA